MIEFANPLALLWLLAVVPAVAAVWYASKLRQRADAAFGGAAELRSERGPWRRPLQLGLLLAALALAAVGVARPQWGAEERELTRLGVDVAIALDISRSMTTQDVRPSRAEVAAWGLTEMLAHLRGDRVGLVTFAGEAFQRSPLTLDLEPLTQLIARSQNEAALVAQGTDLGAALSSAIDLLDVDDPADTQVVVLISDGEDVAGDVDAAVERANDLGIRVYTVAVGTAEGGRMPADDRGTSHRPSLVDVEMLTSIAARTGGNVRGLDAIAGLAVEFQRLRRSAFDEGANQAPIDRFQWFLAGALVLLLAQSWIAQGARAATRLHAPRVVLGATGLLAALLIAACGSPAYEDVQRGNEAYDREAYDDALAAYQEAVGETSDAAETPPPVGYNIGNTLHRLERYEEATVATTAAMDATDDSALLTRAAYARGNHAFKRGDLEAARQAYIGVLLRDPGDVDAKHNLELVLRLLAREEPPPPEPPPRRPGQGDDEDQQSDQDEGDPDDQQQDGGGDGEQGDQPPPDDSGGEGEPGEEGDQPDDRDGDTPPQQQGDAPGERDPAAPDNVDDAREQLSEAILELGDAPLTLEQALDILDLVRITNSLEALEPPDRQAGGALPDR